MIEPLETSIDNAVAFKLSGKLHDEDYQMFVPMVDASIAEHGKTRILAQLVDFHGWDAHALWDDISFATTHCGKVEKVALVGDKQWEKHMATVCKPFTMASIQYFDVSEIDAAWKWLAE